MTRSNVAELLNSTSFLQEVNLKGWVRTFRANRFIALNDGSTINTIQCIVDFENTDMKQSMTMFYEPPRYSSGYAALFGTPGFMPETHMLKPYQQRVQSTYGLMSVFIDKASKSAAFAHKNKYF